MKAILFGMMALVCALPATAQVGHEPSSSPYVDLEYSQEITPLFGYLHTRHDPAGVAPQSAPMVGLRYEWSIAGPLAFSSDLTRSFSHRDVVDPAQPAARRDGGSTSAPVYAFDVALALNLTGRKSWHNIVPQVRAGVGVVQSSTASDSSGYSFGTPFAFSLGGGLKFVPANGRFQFRADVTDRIFKLTYPSTFYRLASDNTAVLPLTTASKFYTHHTALTVGVSYRFAR